MALRLFKAKFPLDLSAITPIPDKIAAKLSTQDQPQKRSMTDMLSVLIAALMTLRDISNSTRLSKTISKLTMLQSFLCVLNMAASLYLQFRPVTARKSSVEAVTAILNDLGYLPYSLVNARTVSLEDSAYGDTEADTSPIEARWSRIPAGNFIDLPGLFTFILNNTDIVRLISLKDDKMEDATNSLIEDLAASRIYTPVLSLFTLKAFPERIYVMKNKPFSEEISALTIDRCPFTGISQSYEPLHVSSQAFKDLHTAFTGSLKGKAVRISAGEYYQSLQMSAVPMTPPEFFNLKIKNRLVELINRASAIDESVTVFLYGYPGVGKTSAIASALNQIGLMPMYIDSSLKYSAVSHLLTLDNRDRILVLEELTALTGEDPEEMNDRMATILKILESRVFRAVIMTSNTTKVNAALSRSGRADIKILCEKPDELEREAICKGLSNKYGQQYDSSFVKDSEGASHADLHSVFRYAKIENKSIYEVLREHRAADALFKKFNPDEGEDECIND